MLQNYLKIALRNLRRHAGYTFINIIGLAVGIACCLLILLFIQDELSYDRFHEKADRIYRVVLNGRMADRQLNAPVTPAPMAFTMTEEYPEVEQATRLFSLTGQVLVRRDDRQFLEERLYFADSTFFDVFTFPLLEGNAETALTEPYTLVLTEAMADKYFPEGGALGQTLTISDSTTYRITGITRDVPANAHFHFDFLASMAGFGPAKNQFWVSNNFNTYLLLQAGTSPEQLTAKFDELMRKYAGPQLQDFSGLSYDQFQEAGNRLDYALQPITDIHLHSDLEFEIEPTGDITLIYIFSAVGFFILLIACINFMNLATARSAGRAREVGIRKVLGSNRRQLIRQFLSESVLMSGFALLLALVLVFVVLGPFNRLADKQISAAVFADPLLIAGLLVLVLGVGLLAGLYPAFFLSSFQPVTVLKGKFQSSTSGTLLRRGLVVFQFAISIALLASTAIVYNQLNYVRQKQLGFDQEHVVVINRSQELETQTDAFKEALRQQSGVVSVAGATTLPGGLFGQTVYRPDGAASDVNILMSPMAADYDFVEAMNMEMAAGRDFDRAFSTDTTAWLINEAAARKLGWTPEEAVGRRLTLIGASRTNDIVGVIKDFHLASLHQEINPLVIGLSTEALPYLTVRIRPENVSGTLAAVEETWRSFAPNQPFDYSFLDEDFDALYRADQRLGNIFTIFSGLAILIACLGLFGLASFMTQQRTKEIGVRKTLGATVPSIVLLLSKEFTRLVAVSFVLATPVAYFAMNRWLSDFAYRIEMPWAIFGLAGLAALAIALGTVSYQAIRAALTDPVQALRYE